MGKISGFLEFPRLEANKRQVEERVRDYREFELPVLNEPLREQGARCMDCGIPFCNVGCPLGNLIPDFNHHVYEGRWDDAARSLALTNNFPEITGRVCPAPCEAACVLGIDDNPVSIKLLEKSIADRSFEATGFVPQPPPTETGKSVAVIGSGPAGMAAAQELRRRGHRVVLYEKADHIGGLLTYGIPDFKLEKSLVDARIEQMRAEGVQLSTGVDIGKDVGVESLKTEFDAVCLAIGSRKPRDLPIPGRELSGIHFAMDFLEQQNRRVRGLPVEGPDILATGKRVIVLGGGDTGSDCIGTSHRQGAVSVTSLEIMPRPPDHRDASTPWPMWPMMLRTSSSHEEGGTRDFGVTTERFVGEGHVQKLECARVHFAGGRFERLPGTELALEADLVLLALGFLHPEHDGWLTELGVELDARGNVKVDESFATRVPGVFAAGDCQRGQSLVVWAIADGRRAAEAIHRHLVESDD